MSAALSSLDPEFRPWAEALVGVAREYRLRPLITSTRRSLREQQRLYDEWLSGRARYPAAPPGRSLHNYGLAFDMVSSDNAWLGEVWKYWGGCWSPGDDVHFAPCLTIGG